MDRRAVSRAARRRPLAAASWPSPRAVTCASPTSRRGLSSAALPSPRSCEAHARPPSPSRSRAAPSSSEAQARTGASPCSRSRATAARPRRSPSAGSLPPARCRPSPGKQPSPSWGATRRQCGGRWSTPPRGSGCTRRSWATSGAGGGGRRPMRAAARRRWIGASSGRLRGRMAAPGGASWPRHRTAPRRSCSRARWFGSARRRSRA
mmetsp:Transcript_37639/g.89406  ORF Transcript_37639/g.89406 Transcript_37639/m.89406 type:complete len:207 (-) Transcript_37639:1827-2447(-)